MGPRKVPEKYLVVSGSVTACRNQVTEQRAHQPFRPGQIPRSPGGGFGSTRRTVRLMGSMMGSRTGSRTGTRMGSLMGRRSRIGGECHGLRERKECGGECVPLSQPCDGQCGVRQCLDKVSSGQVVTTVDPFLRPGPCVWRCLNVSSKFR